ncbi:putative solute carrier family 22 member 5-like [Triplophysa rosa]|uniref:Solute carrier family 22 member 5-like n=1 Tax=Triplophysa rosa TaxID=992332 RepID=A0A9W7TF78_TRIRA|nr:putative solute carrier family 22 member 5-like [Triplophysa rosa]
MKDYEETTAFLGTWGPFQKMVFILLCTSTIPNGFSAFSVIFLADIPPHHCRIPDSNLSDAWRNASIPLQQVEGKLERVKCSRYSLDVIRNFSSLGFMPHDVNLTDIMTESCADGWVYSKDIYQSTIVSEFDLVCNNNWKQPFTSSIYFLGVLCGSFFSGQLSDRFGRKPVLFTTMMVQTFFTFIQVFSPSWEVFSILFFVVGLGQISNYVAAFVLGAELFSGSVRVLYTALGVGLFFAIGYMMLPLIAFYIRDWRMLLVAMSVPGQTCQPNDKNNIWDLVRTRNIRHTTLILFLVWMTLSMGYFGLSLNTSRLHGSPFLNCFISAAIEVPAYVLGWLSLRCGPRRLACSASMLLGGGVLYFIQLVPADLPALSTAFEMLGKFGMAIGTALMFVYTGEIYPTVLRNTAVGSCAMVSRIGSAVAPYFIHLSIFYKSLPHMILGSLCVLSAVSTLFLPETFRRPLPETIQHMQKRQIVTECVCLPDSAGKTIPKFRC